jgi:ABC-type amino acid transport substrate-binding protein
VAPHKPELKTQVDAALERLERNGVYDRINSQYLSIRVN